MKASGDRRKGARLEVVGLLWRCVSTSAIMSSGSTRASAAWRSDAPGYAGQDVIGLEFLAPRSICRDNGIGYSAQKIS
jgi:hypothetical protein